jgi:tetratricopeptide (TPR) repeat protein
MLRAAADLVRAKVPSSRVRRALRQLRSQLPVGRSLASVQVTAEGEQVVVRDGAARWAPETGQVLLDFDVADLARRVAPLVKAAARRGASGGPDADGWYQWGCDLEDGAPEEARRAYVRALQLAPTHGGAHLNLGRLLHEAGELREAEIHYRAALEDPRHRPLAAYNLGVALEDQSLHDEALFAYARAVEADPSLADAHHNLSRLLERLGRTTDALRHLSAYRRLVRGV